MLEIKWSLFYKDSNSVNGYWAYSVSLSILLYQSKFSQSAKEPSCVSTGNQTSFDRKFHRHTQQQVRKLCQLWPAASFINLDTQSIHTSELSHGRSDFLTGYEEVRGQLRAFGIRVGGFRGFAKIGIGSSLDYGCILSILIGCKVERNFLERCRSHVLKAQLFLSLILSQARRK